MSNSYFVRGPSLFQTKIAEVGNHGQRVRWLLLSTAVPPATSVFGREKRHRISPGSDPATRLARGSASAGSLRDHALGDMRLTSVHCNALAHTCGDESRLSEDDLRPVRAAQVAPGSTPTSSRYFDQPAMAEGKRTSIAQREANTVVLDGLNIDDDMKSGEAPHEHATRDLTNVRERCAVNRNHLVPLRPARWTAARRRNRARRDPRSRPKRSGAALAVALSAGCASAVA